MAKEYKIEITFIEEMLGTGSPDPEIHRNFIASKARTRRRLRKKWKRTARTRWRTAK